MTPKFFVNPNKKSPSWDSVKFNSADSITEVFEGEVGGAGLTACLGLTVYDPVGKAGVMAHMMRDRKWGGKEVEHLQPDKIVNYILKNYFPGKSGKGLEASLFGEGTPWKVRVRFLEVLDNLIKNEIPLIGADVGSVGENGGRNAFFYGSSGNVEIYRVNYSDPLTDSKMRKLYGPPITADNAHQMILKKLANSQKKKN